MLELLFTMLFVCTCVKVLLLISRKVLTQDPLASWYISLNSKVSPISATSDEQCSAERTEHVKHTWDKNTEKTRWPLQGCDV